jgi:cellulose synthase/poly-beta-1,6-N-acetylglucosamine synthase-like glycosyltransferase
MNLFLQVIFWLSLGSILSSYLLYPLLVRFFAFFKKEREAIPIQDWPSIEVVFAAYNEESVIDTKIRSILACDYPSEKISISIGSDNSSDATNEILQAWQAKESRLKVKFFKERHGKSAIINQLTAKTQSEFLLLTDANIIFDKDLLKTLVSRLNSDEQAAACGAVIHYGALPQKGISQQENFYLSWENKLKAAESRLWSIVLGLEGGAYLIRTHKFPEIPPLFFMEDFYVSLRLMEQNHNVLWEPKAKVYEDVSVSPQEEYKRKVRIGIGNYQNLKCFKGLILKKFWPIGFAFFAHKILRWLTPFFLILLLFSSTQLTMYHWFYAIFSGLYMVFIGLGLFGILFAQNKGGGFLKYPGHFIYMNLALLEGFMTYIKGIKSNAWEPTARNQH